MVSRRIGFWVVTLCLMLSLSIPSASATSAEGTLRSEAFSEPITITLFNMAGSSSGEQGGWFGKYVKDRWNMTLNIITNDGGSNAKFQTMMAGQNLGDLVIFGSPNQEFQQAMAAGLLLDLAQDDMFSKYMPYFNEHFPVALTRMQGFDNNSGALYGIPTRVSMELPILSQNASEVDYGIMIRYDYFLGIGAPEMETLEDLIDVLAAMKEEYPTTEDGTTTYGASIFNGMDNAAGLAHAQNILGLYGYNPLSSSSVVYINSMGTEYQHVLEEEGLYFRALKFFYELNQRGLLDPDSLTQTQADASAKFGSGSVFYSNWYWEAKNAFNKPENVANGIGYAMAPLLDQKISSTGFAPGGTNGPVLALGKGCVDVARILDFLDWCFTPEGVMTLYNGPEGLTFEYDEESKPYLTEFGKAALPMNNIEVPEEWGGSKFADGFQKLSIYPLSNAETGPFGEAYKYANWSSTLADAMSALDRTWSENMGGARYTKEYLAMNDMLSVIPGNIFTAPSMATDLITMRDQIGNIIKQYSWQMIFAEDETQFDSIKNEMIEMANDLGYEELVEYYLSLLPEIAAARAESVASVANAK